MAMVDITELRSHPPEYIGRAEAGKEITVTRRRELVVRLVPVRDRRAAGSICGDLTGCRRRFSERRACGPRFRSNVVLVVEWKTIFMHARPARPS